jgi:methionine-rich copper-binding protein CopC
VNLFELYTSTLKVWLYRKSKRVGKTLNLIAMKKLFFICIALFAILFSCDEPDIKTPLKVTSVTPSNNAIGVSVEPTITIEFSRTISKDQGNFDGIILENSSGEIVTTAKEVTENGLSISIKPTNKLEGDKMYKLSISEIVADDGEVVRQFSSAFKTGIAPLTLASCSILDGAKDVENLKEIILTFDRKIQKTLANFNSINLVDSKLNPVDGILKFVSDDAKMVTIKFPEYLLDPGATYQVTVKNVTAEDGSKIEHPNIKFTIKDEPFGIVSITPENGSTVVALDTMVVVIFNKKIEGNGLPYFTIIGKCGESWTATTDKMKTITFTCDTILTNNITYSFLKFVNTVSVTGEILSELPPYSFTTVANGL